MLMARLPTTLGAVRPPLVRNSCQTGVREGADASPLAYTASTCHLLAPRECTKS